MAWRVSGAEATAATACCDFMKRVMLGGHRYERGQISHVAELRPPMRFTDRFSYDKANHDGCRRRQFKLGCSFQKLHC